MTYSKSSHGGKAGHNEFNNNTTETFETFGLAPTILKALNSLGYKEPTPIQQQAIPLIIEGHDILGLAQTGTGKTAAFGLPLIQQLMGVGSKPQPKTIRALILAPTRELANQISENLKMFLRNTHLRVATVVGGQSINTQQRNLGRGNDILVATPGRLLDLVERKAVHLDSATFLVLDEADQMLDLGFIHALKRIAKLVAKQRQTLLFSATMPKDIEALAAAYLTDPIRVEVAPPGKAADKIEQEVHFVSRREKPSTLRAMLAKNPKDVSLVFARTKHGAEKLMKGLVEQGFPAGSIHGNKSQGQRDRAIRAFKSGEIRILVATDVAARGIDISGVSHVYNYDLPEVPANYVHRIGRTARAGAEGNAVAFCAPDELHLLKAIEKEMGMKIPVVGETFSRAEAVQGEAEAKEAKRNRGRPAAARRGTPERAEAGRGGRKGGDKQSAGKHKKVAAINEQREADAAEPVAPVMDDYARVRAAGFTGKPNSKKNRKRFGPRSDEGMVDSPQTSGDVAQSKAKKPANRHSPDSRGQEAGARNGKAKGGKFKSERQENGREFAGKGFGRKFMGEGTKPGKDGAGQDKPYNGKPAEGRHRQAGESADAPARGGRSEFAGKPSGKPNGKPFGKPGGKQKSRPFAANGGGKGGSGKEGGWKGRKRKPQTA